MTDPQPVERITIENEQSLNTLVRAINYSQGEFSLILARCNYAALQQKITQVLREQCPIDIRELNLPPSSRTLYTAIKSELGDNHPSALMIFGLEGIEELDAVLTSTNQVREEFRKEFSFPLVLWINDTILQKLIKLVPDLESWSTAVEFEMTVQDLLERIQQTTDEVFTRVLDAGSGPFQGSSRFKLSAGSCRWEELEFAHKDLQSQGVSLEPELAASFEFVLGRAVANSMEQSQQHYERSLTLWQNTSDLVRQGYVAFNLGVWWRTYAAQHRNEFDQSCQKAAQYFRQAVEVFEQGHRPDLIAKFINPLGEVLQRLEQWEELEEVAKKSLALNQNYSDLYRQADAHGLIATVAVSKADWSTAKQAAEIALQCLETAIKTETKPLSPEKQVLLNWERFFKQGWYLLALGKAQWHLGRQQDGIHTLEFAKTETRPDYDPSLYIQILQELRRFYFEQKDYLKAFETRILYRSIEQQYGFQAFVGAGRLQPHKSVVNPALIGIGGQEEELSQEISASGRQQDVSRLIERLGRSDQKLTIIHGQSGVGKSSILQAGLIPALNPITFDTREVVSILLQVYNNWSERLGQELLEALKSFERLSLPDRLNSPSTILEQLRSSVNQNLMVVLIFDQFEEFFFVYKDPVERKPFYEFLKNCLNIPYVKVILSLREDYLHFLLECNDRLVNLDIINNNILDKNILFYLGNFSREDARSVITALTHNTPMSLEQPLVDQLVDDLSEELGEVRPIELQITGAQLQSEGITTLQQYQERGPKDTLVGRFLEEVTKDCGHENEQIAKLVLYLLTDENNTRPLKTHADLEMELNVAEKLDLILAILVKSGLVFRIPASPADRYQLVHDYLVLFIRQKQSAQLIGELEKEREQRKLTEAKLNQALTKQLKTARRATYSLAALVAAIAGFAVLASFVGTNTYLSSQNLTASKKNELDRLVASLKTGKQQKSLSIATLPEFQQMTSIALIEAVYGIREANRLEGHTGGLSYVEFSPDDQLIATASEDKTAKIWSIDGKILTTLEGHTGKVIKIRFSPDSKLVATTSEDNTAKIWRLDGKLLTTLKGHIASVNDISFSPDNKLIATASEDKTVNIWNANGRFLRTLPHEASITAIRFSSDGRLLATASQDDIVKLWSLDREGSKPITINNYGAIDIQFGTDRKTLIFPNKDKTIKFWSLDGRLLRNISFCCGEPISLNLSPNHKIFASASKYRPNTVELFRLNDLSNAFFYYGSDYLGEKTVHSDRITHLSFSHNGKFLASASKDKTVRIWSLDDLPSHILNDRETEINNLQFKPDGQILAVGYPDRVELKGKEGNLKGTLQANGSILKFSPLGNGLLTSSNRDVVRLWKRGGKEITLQGHNQSINNLRFSPDGKLLASVSNDNTIKLWNQNGVLLKTLSGHTEPIEKIRFSPNGRIFASWGKDNKIMLWEKYGTLIKQLSGHFSRVTDVQFSDDSTFIASIGDDNLVQLWRSDGSPIKTLIGHPDKVSSIRFSPDSQILASVSGFGADSTIKLWRSSDGIPLKTIRSYNVKEAIFSPNGNTIATLGTDEGLTNIQSKTVQIWSLNGTLQTTLEGHSDTITDVKFNPDGSILATGSKDNTVKLWKQNGSLITTLRGHNSTITDISFSSDGKLLVSSSSDNMVKLWSHNGKELQTLQEAVKEPDEEYYDGGANQVAFVANNANILFIGSRKNSRIKLWSKTGKEIANLQGIYEERNSYRTDFSDDGQQIAIPTQENALKLWGIHGKLQAELIGHTDVINDAAFNREGNLIASASDDNTVKLWQTDGKLLKTLQHNDKANAVSFSSKNLIASASDDKTIKLWDSHGTLLKILNHEDKVNSISFNSTGDLLASASDDRTVKLWQSDGAFIRSLNHDDKVKIVSFSPDGKILASASKDGTVKIWNTDNGKEIAVHKGNSGSLPILRFSPDSKILLIRDDKYSGEFKVYVMGGLWFQSTNDPVHLRSSFSDLVFNPDGQTIAIATGSDVQFLGLGLDTLLKRGCNWVRNYLTYNPNLDKNDRTICDDI